MTHEDDDELPFIPPSDLPWWKRKSKRRLIREHRESRGAARVVLAEEAERERLRWVTDAPVPEPGEFEPLPPARSITETYAVFRALVARRGSSDRPAFGGKLPGDKQRPPSPGRPDGLFTTFRSTGSDERL